MDNLDINILRAFTIDFLSIKGIGDRTVKKLLDRFAIEDIYNLNFEFPENKDSEKLLKSAINNAKDNNIASQSILKENINFICLWQDEYPQLLKDISDAPIVLYYKGEYNIKNINNSLSIVGSRKYSNYGKSIALSFAQKLAESGYTITSGMAIGIDSFAHQGALNANGYTIAVLAGNVNCPTPLINSNLYKNILDNGGLILSDNLYKGQQMNPGLFASRNRIVAGISKGTIIIEAADKSGALITANLALDYNREVFAVPGQIDLDSYKGNNRLIMNGSAKLVLSVEDIMCEFDDMDKYNIIHGEESGMTDTEMILVRCISSGNTDVDYLANIAKLEKNQLLFNLTNLEIKGLIQRDFNGNYIKVIK